MRILLTGASGFVGRAVGRRLLAAGNEVVGVARSAGGDEVAEWAEVDLSRPDAADALGRLAPCDAVVHAAAEITYELDAPGPVAANCAGTQAALSAALRWQSSALVYISSIGVIGVPTELPVTEDHPVAPPTGYHAAKLFGEHLMKLASEGGLRTVSLRLTSPVGAGMPPQRILPTFVAAATAGRPLEVAGGGTRSQNYVDVRDAAAAVEAALRGGTGVVNLGGAASITNLELARLCVEETGSSSAVDTGGIDAQEGVRWEISLARAATQLSYAPAYSLSDSIASIAEEAGE